MEPPGCNQRQTVANGTVSETGKQAKTVAVDCHRLPERFHGKQGVCRGLPPVAGGPLPAREEVDLRWDHRAGLLLSAVRAWAPVAAAVRACLTDHGRILSNRRSRRCAAGANLPRSAARPRP